MRAMSEVSELLGSAALFAGRAPSLHNSQPWHWHVSHDELDLRLEPRRVLRSSDPVARLAVLSCGAALHHARIDLAAGGWRAGVVRLPDAADPDLLARLRLDGRAPVDHDAVRLVRAAARRRTDRRSPSGAPLDLDRVRSIRRAVHAEGADLTPLRPRQVFALAEAADRAQAVEAADPGWQAELADWIGGDRPLGTGIPAEALPADPYLLTAPVRALRPAGARLIRDSRQHERVFAVLHSTGDARHDWLTAGEALSAGWLTATDLDVAVVPLSVVAEVPGSRDRIRHLLDSSGYPQLVLRFTAGVADDPAPSVPRLPVSAVMSHADDHPRPTD
jgi:hypothetical protein